MNPRSHKPAPSKPSKTAPSRPSAGERMEAWSRRNRRWVLLSIVVLSALVRVIYFIQLDRTHLVFSHKWKESDMYVFDQWAKAIASGDILSARYEQEQHVWMKVIADRYFGDHPGKLAEYRQKALPDTTAAARTRLLWKQWLGVNAFPHEPFYAYFLAADYSLFGTDVRWVFLWQMILGILTNLLVWLTARRYFGDLAGLVAAFLALFCGPVLFYELVLLRSSLACLVVILILFLTHRAAERTSFPRWLAVGLAGGVAMTIHTYFLFWFVAMIVVLAFIHRRDLPRLGVAAGAFALGFFLALSPVILRNLWMGVGPLTMSNAGAISFITMNNDTFPGSFVGWAVNAGYVSDIMGRADGSLWRTLVLTLKTHPSAGSYLLQEWSKLQASFSWFEIPNNANFYFYREFAPVLNITFAGFLLLAPFGLAGMILALVKRRSGVWPFVLMFLILMFPLVVFMVLSRYRVMLAMVFIPCAGYAVAQLLGPWKGVQNWLLLAGILALGYLSRQPRDYNTIPLSRADYETVFNVHYADSLQAASDRRDWKNTDRLVGDFIDRYEPPEFLARKDYYRAKNQKESDIYTFFSVLRSMRSSVLMQLPDTARSRHEARLSEKLKNAAAR